MQSMQSWMQSLSGSGEQQQPGQPSTLGGRRPARCPGLPLVALRQRRSLERGFASLTGSGGGPIRAHTLLDLHVSYPTSVIVLYAPGDPASLDFDHL